ncbi:MAG: serine protein kinase, partial [Planctomycetota bacterium]|nr:serine protein kinase [Planctomycetota bacterium]
MADSIDINTILQGALDTDTYHAQHWQGSFSDYMDIVAENPLVVRSAHQRVYDMVLSYGTEEVELDRAKLTRYKFFDDLIDDGEDGLYGLDRPLMNLMNVLKAAAHGYGPERRVLLLHGPVGSSKSTIARMLKKG